MRYPVSLICFLLSATTLFAADYYVDSQTGDDARDGLAPQTAWKSLDAVNKAELKPGDTIRFKKDGRWRGQLKPKSGEAGRPVVYTSYGDGKEKPSLLGSIALNKHSDWIDEGGGIWSTRPNTILSGPDVSEFLSLRWNVHRESGAKVDVKTAPQNRVTASADVKEYTLSCQASGTKSNHIQLIVSGFKAEAGKNYLFRFYAKSDKPFTIPGIGFSEPGAPWGGLGGTLRRPGEIGPEWKEYEILLRCDADHDKARLTLHLGEKLPEGAVFFFVPKSFCEATIESNGIDSDVGNIILDGAGKTPKAAFKKWTKDDLKNEDDFWFDLKTNQVYYLSKENPAKRFQSIEAALYRHVVNHGNCSHVVFDGLDIRYGAAHGFGGSKVKHCVYRNLDISWIGGADQYRQGGEGRRVRFGNGIEFWADAEDCLVEHCRIWEIYDAALTNQGSGVNVERNITYRDNVIWNSEYSFEYWNRGPESVTENVIFENNLCYDAGYGWGYAQRPNKNGRHVMIYNNPAKTKDLIIRNNLFVRSKDSAVRIDSDFRDGLIMEGNTYVEEPGRDLFMWLVKNHYKTDQLAQYQNEVGLDKTSTWKKPDPKFKRPDSK